MPDGHIDGLSKSWILTLEPERFNNREASGRMTLGWPRLSSHAQAVCRFSCPGSKSSPFFQIFKAIAAILRATVRRAIAGFIPVDIPRTSDPSFAAIPKVLAPVCLHRRLERHHVQVDAGGFRPLLRAGSESGCRYENAFVRADVLQKTDERVDGFDIDLGLVELAL